MICDYCLHNNICEGGRWIKDEIEYRLIDCADFLGWIHVSKGLPIDGKTVIASTKYGVYPEARYTKEDGWEWAYESGANYWVELEDVTAWMPLPKCYEAES